MLRQENSFFDRTENYVVVDLFCMNSLANVNVINVNSFSLLLKIVESFNTLDSPQIVYYHCSDAYRYQAELLRKGYYHPDYCEFSLSDLDYLNSIW